MIFLGTPSIIDLEKNISFRIINNHRSMINPRPAMPGLAYVAGVQIKPTKALPDDIKVTDTPHSTIFPSQSKFHFIFSSIIFIGIS